MFALSNPILECDLYMHCRPSVDSADQSLRSIVQYKACRKEKRAFFSTIESVLPVLKIIRNNRALNGGETQTLADFTGVQRHRVMDKLFQSLGND